MATGARPEAETYDQTARQAEVTIMSKGMDSKKQLKKKPLKSAHEKRVAKKAKHAGKTLLGSHSAGS